MKRQFTYRIRIETEYGILYHNKEYYNVSNVFKATEMINFRRLYGLGCTVRVLRFNEGACYATSEPLTIENHTKIPELEIVS